MLLFRGHLTETISANSVFLKSPGLQNFVFFCHVDSKVSTFRGVRPGSLAKTSTNFTTLVFYQIETCLTVGFKVFTNNK